MRIGKVFGAANLATGQRTRKHESGQKKGNKHLAAYSAGTEPNTDDD